MQARKLFFLPLILLGLCLACVAQDEPQPSKTIEGNWHLTGGWDPLKLPSLAFAIGVRDSTVYGRGNLQANCSGKNGTTNAYLTVEGQIASDGTFVLASSKESSVHVAIRGKLPVEGSTTWEGSFRAFASASPPEGLAADHTCTFDVSGNFIAEAYRAFKGIYGCTVTSKSIGADLKVTTEITSGDLASVAWSPPHPFFYYIPLNATVTITGPSELTEGTTTSSQVSMGSNSIRGDFLQLDYAMSGGSKKKSPDSGLKILLL